MFPDLVEQEIEITISCGVAELPNASVPDGRALLETAASALKRALRRGGDQTVLL